jgi:hypothetical protein
MGNYSEKVTKSSRGIFFRKIWKIENRVLLLHLKIVLSQVFLFEFVIKKGRGFAPVEALATVQSRRASASIGLKMVLIRAYVTKRWER